MAYWEIPETAVEVQTGLWANQKIISAGNITIIKHDLYSSQGYCFYCPEENLDEDGNLLPENERIYAQYRSTTCTTIEQINAKFVSVPVQDGYEIVSVGGNHESI